MTLICKIPVKIPVKIFQYKCYIYSWTVSSFHTSSPCFSVFSLAREIQSKFFPWLGTESSKEHVVLFAGFLWKQQCKLYAQRSESLISESHMGAIQQMLNSTLRWLFKDLVYMDFVVFKVNKPDLLLTPLLCSLQVLCISWTSR